MAGDDVTGGAIFLRIVFAIILVAFACLLFLYLSLGGHSEGDVPGLGGGLQDLLLLPLLVSGTLAACGVFLFWAGRAGPRSPDSGPS